MKEFHLLNLLKRLAFKDQPCLILFLDAIIRENEINPPIVQVEPEYRKHTEFSKPEITTKNTGIEQIKYEERSSKSVSKIMIFYSDNTFETFTPEKNKKE